MKKNFCRIDQLMNYVSIFRWAVNIWSYQQSCCSLVFPVVKGEVGYDYVCITCIKTEMTR